MTDVITRTQTQLVELDFDIAELNGELMSTTDEDTAEELSNTLAAYREVRAEFENRLHAAINGEDEPTDTDTAKDEGAPRQTWVKRKPRRY